MKQHPKSDWQYEVTNNDTELSYHEWLMHMREADMDESKAIIDSYPKGKCPDCQKKIPADVQEGESCKNCGHVFTRE
jgi:Zn finger protein HypA/HybF involved in hydrogenase expression